MEKCLVFGIRKSNTDLKDFFFFLTTMNFVLESLKRRKGIIKHQSVARRNEGDDVYKSHSTVFVI